MDAEYDTNPTRGAEMPGEMVTLELHAHGTVKVRVYREAYERAKTEARVGLALAHHLREVETDFEIHEEDGTVVDVETGAIFSPPEPVFLLWSLADRMWWKTPGDGWTPDVWRAARFTADEALHSSSARKTLIVLAPEAGRDPRFDPQELAGIDNLMAERIAAVQAGIEAVKEQMK